MRKSIILEGGLPDLKITNHIVESSCFYYATRDYEKIIPYSLEIRFYNLLNNKREYKDGQSFEIDMDTLCKKGIKNFDNTKQLQSLVREVAVWYLKHKYKK